MASIVTLLPAEVIDKIFDMVASDDQKARPFLYRNTKACSLTCRTFSRLCRRHIFHSIILHETSYTTSAPTALSFANLITDQPNIANYVRELHYVMLNSFDYTNVHQYPPVPSALELITNLKTLVLFPHEGTGLFNWKHNHLPSRYPLLHLMHLSTLKSLELMFIENLSQYDLFLCTGIKYLRLKCVFIAEIGQMPPQMPSTEVMQIRRLSMGHRDVRTMTKLAKQKCSDGILRFSLGKLEDISVFMVDEEDKLSFLEIVGYTCRLQTIRLISFHASLIQGVLPQVPAILETSTRLCLHLYVEEDNINAMGGICTVLQELTGRNHIEQLEITIESRISVESINVAEWGLLEKVLLVPGWSSLKVLDLEIIVEGKLMGNAFERELRHLPQTQFSGFSSSESLKFVFSARELELPDYTSIDF